MSPVRRHQVLKHKQSLVGMEHLIHSGQLWGIWCYSVTGSHENNRMKTSVSERNFASWRMENPSLFGWTVMKFCWPKWEGSKEVWKPLGKSWPDYQHWLRDLHGLLPAPVCYSCSNLWVSDALKLPLLVPRACAPSFVLTHSGASFVHIPRIRGFSSRHSQIAMG